MIFKRIFIHNPFFFYFWFSVVWFDDLKIRKNFIGKLSHLFFATLKKIIFPFVIEWEEVVEIEKILWNLISHGRQKLDDFALFCVIYWDNNSYISYLFSVLTTNAEFWPSRKIFKKKKHLKTDFNRKNIFDSEFEKGRSKYEIRRPHNRQHNMHQTVVSDIFITIRTQIYLFYRLNEKKASSFYIFHSSV